MKKIKSFERFSVNESEDIKYVKRNPHHFWTYIDYLIKSNVELTEDILDYLNKINPTKRTTQECIDERKIKINNKNVDDEMSSYRNAIDSQINENINDVKISLRDQYFRNNKKSQFKLTFFL